MLYSYSITNFNSIKNECKISFAPSSLKEDDKKLLMDNKILPIVAIYGANGSGKTSILESMQYITNLLKAQNLNNFINILNSINNFKNKSLLDEETTFIFEFLLENNFIYKYEVKINDKKISLEKLSKKQNKSKQKFKTIYEINENKISPSSNKIFVNLAINIDEISGLYYFNSITKNDDIKLICDEIDKIKCFQINALQPLVQSPINPFEFNWNFDIHLLKKEKNKFLKIFKEIDLNIIDIEIKKNQFNQHDIIFTKNSIYGKIELPFMAESTGTKKIIQFLCDFVKFSDTGCVFCIDELDASLHPELLAYIIKLFNSKNNNNMQLLYTSHDLYTLSSEFFRKDEVYFTGLNESYFTDIISLNEYKNLNKNSSFSKKYINGEIGYGPYIDKAINWNE